MLAATTARPTLLLPAGRAGRTVLVLLAVLVAAALAPPPVEAQPRRSVDREATATGTGGAAASLDPRASQVAVDVLRRGGNAVDAAVAGAAMLGVVRPYDGGIGGGGFMVVYLADEQRVYTIDHRETAPAAYHPDIFFENGTTIPFAERVTSGLGVGVPGVVLGWEEALARWGTQPLARLLQPARTAAQSGFIVDQAYHDRTVANADRFRQFTSSAELFLPDGQAPAVGERIRNRDLADTYHLLGRHGSDAFYSGPLAQAIVNAVTDPPVVPNPDREIRPGVMTTADLAAYTAPVREPTASSYRGYDIYGMGPPTSGGLVIGHVLNVLEGWDLGALPREQALHYYIEATKLAWADRAAYMADPEFVDVPVAGLLAQSYADERRQLIGEQAAEQFPPGDPWAHQSGATAASALAEGGSTTHITVADRHGNLVAYTFTIEQIGGSGITVPGYGFLLNNELTDFDLPPHPNEPDGGKRPRSSMSPTIVLRDGEPVLGLGSPGGARIITTVQQILLNYIDFGMSLPAAIAEPRVSGPTAAATVGEPAFLQTPEAAALQARGHTLGTVATLGNANGVVFLPDGRLQAAAEPERLGGGGAAVVTADPRPRPTPRGR